MLYGPAGLAALAGVLKLAVMASPFRTPESVPVSSGLAAP